MIGRSCDPRCFRLRLITLAAGTGGYALAGKPHLSGPLAMLVAGRMEGDQGRVLALSGKTPAHVDMFWELIDEILNAILFVLFGLRVVRVPFSKGMIIGGFIEIIITLDARLVTAGMPIGSLFRLPIGPWKVLTWSGLRGSISVAPALSLSPSPESDVVVGLTYMVVVFSTLGQGLCTGKVARKSMPCAMSIPSS